ncbi:MAG TPA: Uma2 family endonuclease [Chloroflexota bacterium]|nr:Uma2 family endonuclease [Chloroflexota bacterium]
MSAIQLRRWTRVEYDKMIEAGIFGPEERVELIEGEIVGMSPQDPSHSVSIQLAAEALHSAFRTGFHIRVQLPMALDDSEPEPDVAVVRGNIRDFRDSHPSTAVLLVEVADSSLEFDRRRKGRVYARNRIPEYWIVNLLDRTVEVYREPRLDGNYALVQQFTEADSLSPLASPDTSILVSTLLP